MPISIPSSWTHRRRVMSRAISHIKHCRRRTFLWDALLERHLSSVRPFRHCLATLLLSPEENERKERKINYLKKGHKRTNDRFSLQVYAAENLWTSRRKDYENSENENEFWLLKELPFSLKISHFTWYAHWLSFMFFSSNSDKVNISFKVLYCFIFGILQIIFNVRTNWKFLTF